MPKKPFFNPPTKIEKSGDRFTAPVIVKMVVFALFLLGASAAFGYTVLLTGREYLEIMMFLPETQTIGLWLILSFTALIVTASLVAVFVKPRWASLLAFVFSALVIVAFNGFEFAIVIVSLIYLLFCVSFNTAVGQNTENQIKFSIYPLSHSYKILLVAVSIFLATGFALGYQKDSSLNNFVVPPPISKMMKESAIKQAKETAVKEGKLTEEQIALGLKDAEKKADEAWTGIEKQLEPAKPYVAPFFGIMMFTFIQSVLLLISGIPLIFLAGIFPLLKLMRVTHLKTEMREVTRYSLE
jgi:hypothetical protein